MNACQSLSRRFASTGPALCLATSPCVLGGVCMTRASYATTNNNTHPQSPRRQPVTPFQRFTLFTIAFHTVSTRLRRANCCSRIRSCGVHVQCR